MKRPATGCRDENRRSTKRARASGEKTSIFRRPPSFASRTATKRQLSTALTAIASLKMSKWKNGDWAG
uniref:Uncharacterized protein n=1 Tax=Romanomermis culicivorax TaxID=13658 RepID=A0A915KSV8_ROMCU